MLAADSSSLNDSLVISYTEQVSSDCWKISVSGDLLFFVRTEYLKVLKNSELVSGKELTDEQFEDLTDAGLIFAAESKACQYLARAEQCRYGLILKLTAKGFLKKHVEQALNYLQKKNFLNDVRFSSAWLNSRKISHFESRSKLLGELTARGIARNDAEIALDEFFLENSEEEMCLKAYEKLLRQKKPEEKIIRSLLNCGFSYKQIKNVMSEASDYS